MSTTNEAAPSPNGTEPLIVRPVRGLRGDLWLPGDKSISHRALILGSLCQGTLRIENCSSGQDVLSTACCLSQLGVSLRRQGGVVEVQGTGGVLREPSDILDAGNSGTTMRLLAGLLSAQPFFSVLTGDASLRRRPMARVVTPLRRMGAEIRGREGGRFAPLAIQGGPLSPIQYESPVASAQVKTALLLAGLFLQGETSIREPLASRDHTERMLKHLGADISWQDRSVRLLGGRPLKARDLVVPGDPSSAAFFVVAALITADSDIRIRSICANPSRTGYLRVLERMGAFIEWTEQRECSGEPVADLRVRTSSLTATEIPPEEVPATLDEIPVLCVAAAFARGRTRIWGAAELRVKESDRIAAMASNLAAMGVRVREFEDGLEIEGQGAVEGFQAASWDDHRIAMSMVVAALAARSPSRISGASCMGISFPEFLDRLALLTRAE